MRRLWMHFKDRDKPVIADFEEEHDDAVDTALDTIADGGGGIFPTTGGLMVVVPPGSLEYLEVSGLSVVKEEWADIE